MQAIYKQLKQTVEQERLGVTIRLGTITCGCGTERAVLKMYQCLYCSEWYCQPCAEIHFGKTIQEYRSENE